MAYLSGFGHYLPERIVDNREMAGIAGCEPEWIEQVSGIETRRFARDDESVPQMGAAAARNCLELAGIEAKDLGLLLVSSGSPERRFPGPAAEVANLLGLDATPAIDVPVASAGSLFALSLASRLAAGYGNVLVVAAEKMSRAAIGDPVDRNVAILFGDGAGACLVCDRAGSGRVIDSALYTDGAFAGELKMECGRTMEMNGRSVIMHAWRKIPRAIAGLLEKNCVPAGKVSAFLMHQANRNLIVRIAQTLGVAQEKFYTNIERYGNTSSASMLIAASEWSQSAGFRTGEPIVFAAFGAGYHWGALLAEGV